MSTTSPDPEALDAPGASPLDAARALRPLLAAHAERCAAEGKIPDPVMQALHDSGLFLLTAPRRAGGMGAGVIVHIEVSAELAQGCVSAAWSYSLVSMVTGSVRAMLPAVTERAFARGDELCCAAAAPTGTADPVEGGYRVNGRWGYGSGCRNADWALNGITLRDADQRPAGEASCLIDLASPQVEILDDWQVAGMAGSGSNTIVARDLFIPAALMLVRPTGGPAFRPQPPEPRDRWPGEPNFPLSVIGPMLGAATALLHGAARQARGRPVAWWSYQSQADSQRLTGMVGQAALAIDTAWLHVRRAAALIDADAQQRRLSGFEKARIQADVGYAAGLLREAGSTLMDVAGPGAFALANPLQRIWRDLNVGSRHNVLHAEFAAELYGRAILGQPSNIKLISDIGPPPEWAA